MLGDIKIVEKVQEWTTRNPNNISYIIIIFSPCNAAMPA